VLGIVIDPHAVIEFWFGELSDGKVSKARKKLWFSVSADFDARCKDAFAGAYADLPQFNWRHDENACLAYILLTDQLPRNIFRGTKKAFAWDQLAVKAAKDGIASGFDTRLNLDQRTFFYMPFEHSETRLNQYTAVGLFTSLRDQAPAERKSELGNSLRVAQKHRDIILRFGRFPHRNNVLGRTSTEAELAFISQGEGFGQS